MQIATFRTLALAAGISAAGILAPAQDPAKPAARAGMNQQCRQMMSMHGKMMDEMKQMDAALEQKVSAMNAAKGDAKVNAMAAVINEMIAQRRQHIEKMSAMRDGMMAHMGSHMAQSGGKTMKESMANCPMMKGQKDMHGKAAEAPK